MKKLLICSMISASALYLSACAGFDTGADRNYGWNNHPQSDTREVVYESDYSSIRQNNSTTALDTRGDYVSDYSTQRVVETEIRYVPVISPWWSSYYYTYNEPIYYYPGIYISIGNFGYPRYYPHYDYYWNPYQRWDPYWQCYHPYYYYPYNGYWDSYYYSDRYDHWHGHKDNRPNTAFGGRVFGPTNGSKNPDRGSVSAPISTTPKTPTRGDMSNTSSGNASGINAPINTNNNGAKKPIFNNNAGKSVSNNNANDDNATFKGGAKSDINNSPINSNNNGAKKPIFNNNAASSTQGKPIFNPGSISKPSSSPASETIIKQPPTSGGRDRIFGSKPIESSTSNNRNDSPDRIRTESREPSRRPVESAQPRGSNNNNGQTRTSTPARTETPKSAPARTEAPKQAPAPSSSTSKTTERK
jgi:hypothetical protein